MGNDLASRPVSKSIDKREIIDRLYLHAVAGGSIAVQCGPSSVSYQELTEQLTQRMATLTGAVRPGTVIPVRQRRSVEFVVDFLAILALDAIPVPIDPELPAARVETLLELAGGPTTPSLSGTAAQDGCYVFFTSGSTGRPKPVLGSARALRSFLEWQCDQFGIRTGDRIAFLTALSFDVSVRDMFLPLWAGATLVIPAAQDTESPEATVAWLARRHVSVVNVVPSVARGWLRHADGPCESLRTVFFAGEPLAADLVDGWHGTFPGTEVLVNFYGTTETTLPKVYRTVSRTERFAGNLPAGRPVPGARYCLIDPAEPFDAQVVRAGLANPAAAGEIVLVTRHAGHGYLGLPAETAARFVALSDGRTAYRTGDLGRVDGNGELHVTGRADDELKINGVRMHPAEIAAAIRAECEVTDVFVTTTHGPDARLTAFVVPGDLDTGALRRALTGRLPPAMVPARFVALPALPALPNGKVDRAALPAIAGSAPPATPFVAPAGEQARWLAAVWGELFDVADVSATADFFALGGDSITAMRLAARIRGDTGVVLSVREIFAAATVTAIADLIGDVQPAAGRPMTRVDRCTGRLPMSFAQRRLYFLQEMTPDSPAYNVVEAMRLRGPLDRSAVRAAVAALVARHEVLRTTCSSDGPEPDLVLADPATVDIRRFVDFARRPGGAEWDGLADVLAFLEQRAATPFDLEHEFPLRVTVARVAEDEHVIMFVTHHIATDAWSSRLLVTEFLRAYRTPDLGELPVQYGDFAAWQRDQLTDDVIEAHLAYWRERLAGLPPLLELPAERPRTALPDEGAEIGFALDAGLSHRLRVVAREASVTPFVLLLTAFGYVLHRHCATDDVVVGTPVSGRDRPEVEHVIGCFINTLLLRMDFTWPTLTCRELVRRVSDDTLDAYEHQDLPFERLVAELNPDRDPAAAGLVQVMFNYHAATVLDDVPGLAVDAVDIGATRARFDLSCTVEDDGDALCGTLTYAVALLSGDVVRRIGQHFVAVLTALAADIDAPVDSLPPVPAADSALPAGPDVAPRYAEAAALLDRFEDYAATDPGRAAVRCRDDVATYGDVNARANRLARYLVAGGTGPGDHVALLFERSVDCVVAMLAVQKAGAAYLPLDPAVPASHVAAILAESPGTLLLTHNEIDRTEVAALAPARVSIVVLEEIADALADASTANLPRRATDYDVMYVVFTSGSTGRPKGVVVRHRNFTHYLAAILDRLDVPDGLHFALVSTMAADLGLTNLYGALATGGTVHLLPYEWAVDPEQFAAYFRRHPIDFLKLVPSHLRAIDDAGLLADVVPRRYLMLAGEACPGDLVAAVHAARPECTVWNTYGPTETTVAVLAHQVPAVRSPDDGPVVPLGTPIGNARIRVVDAHLRPVPVGTPGELLISGPSVARGYLSADEHAAQRFVDDPVTGEQAYRSGDRGRLRHDGTFEFLGRLDRQTKIRGYRVEPGYVESVLRGHPGITDVAVAVRTDGHGAARLIAYCVRAASGSTPQDYARAMLPPYMVPAAYVTLDRLPLTPNGKVDWQALPEPDPQARDEPVVAPRDARDERIAGIWRDLLGLADVGIDDDFFALGGDSFAAMRMARLIGDGLRVATIFQHPTIRELADMLGGGTAPGLIYRLSGGAPARATIVAVPFGGGNAAAFGELARALPPEYALYAVDPPGHDFGSPDSALVPFAELAALCVAEIRAEVTGPVVVYGHCLGAALAFDIAQRLRAAGAVVVGVVFGGAFPAPRLPGRIFDLWARMLPSDRWRSDKLYRDTLRGIGGLDQTVDPGEQAFILRALRHDSRQAEAFYTAVCHDQDHERTLPALAVVGERDRLTEFHEERHHEWDLLCATTELKVIPAAGHFFLKHQADALATILTSWIGRRLADVPAPPSRVAAPRSGLWGFGLVTLGQLVSMIGTRALMFGLGVWVFLRTGSATQFSVILVCGLLPSLLVLPFAGAAADRWNRRLVMIAGDVAAVAGSGFCLAMFVTGRLEVWHLYLATGFSSVAGAFQQPAYLAATAQLVPKQYLGRTNGITQALVAVSQAAGPLLGGALIVLIGLGGMLGVDLVTVFVSLATLLAVRFPDTLFRKREESIWKEIGGGVRYIARRRSFVAMITFFLAFNLILGFAIALTAPMALSFASPGALSVASMLGAVGGIAGGVAMALWGGFERRATGMVGFTLLTGAGMIVLGLRPNAVFLTIGLAAIAASLALLNGHWQTMIQTKVGMELQGRILAGNRMVANLTEPLGYFCAGALADAFFEPAMRSDGWLRDSVGGLLGVGPGRGMALMIVVLGIGLVVLAVAGLRWRTLRYMEDTLPDAIPGAVVTWDRDALQREADELLATAREMVDA